MVDERMRQDRPGAAGPAVGGLTGGEFGTELALATCDLVQQVAFARHGGQGVAMLSPMARQDADRRTAGGGSRHRSLHGTWALLARSCAGP